jgi:hypothetical protein
MIRALVEPYAEREEEKNLGDILNVGVKMPNKPHQSRARSDVHDVVSHSISCFPFGLSFWPFHVLVADEIYKQEPC